jgi:hypothetical protein
MCCLCLLHEKIKDSTRARVLISAFDFSLFPSSATTSLFHFSARGRERGWSNDGVTAASIEITRIWLRHGNRVPPLAAVRGTEIRTAPPDHALFLFYLSSSSLRRSPIILLVYSSIVQFSQPTFQYTFLSFYCISISPCFRHLLEWQVVQIRIEWVAVRTWSLIEMKRNEGVAVSVSLRQNCILIFWWETQYKHRYLCMYKNLSSINICTHIFLMSISQRLSQLDLKIHEVSHQERLAIDEDVASINRKCNNHVKSSNLISWAKPTLLHLDIFKKSNFFTTPSGPFYLSFYY